MRGRSCRRGFRTRLGDVGEPCGPRLRGRPSGPRGCGLRGAVCGALTPPSPPLPSEELSASSSSGSNAGSDRNGHHSITAASIIFTTATTSNSTHQSDIVHRCYYAVVMTQLRCRDRCQILGERQARDAARAERLRVQALLRRASLWQPIGDLVSLCDLQTLFSSDPPPAPIDGLCRLIEKNRGSRTAGSVNAPVAGVGRGHGSGVSVSAR